MTSVLMPWLRSTADRAVIAHDWREFNRLRGLALIATGNTQILESNNNEKESK